MYTSLHVLCLSQGSQKCQALRARLENVRAESTYCKNPTDQIHLTDSQHVYFSELIQARTMSNSVACCWSKEQVLTVIFQHSLTLNLVCEANLGCLVTRYFEPKKKWLSCNRIPLTSMTQGKKKKVPVSGVLTFFQPGRKQALVFAPLSVPVRERAVVGATPKMSFLLTQLEHTKQQQRLPCLALYLWVLCFLHPLHNLGI